LRGRSLNELRVRGLQALSARLERVVATRGDTEPPAHLLAVPLSPERWFAAFRPNGADAIAGALAQADPQTVERLRELSDGLEHGVMPLLGYDSLAVGHPPHWHTEAASGRQAPRRHWSRIDHLDVGLVGDHKILWELNRHQYLLAPAYCWLLDREPRRFALIEAHLDSWLRANPRGEGINWVSSLEIAYRAISWCWLLWMLPESAWTAQLRARLLAALADHATHIERYLSTYFSPNTHLTGEALGLFYIGSVLPRSRATERWCAKGARILEACLERQIHSDGVYFEQSTQYQRYTIEIYLHYCLLGEGGGWPVSARVRAALNGMCTVLRSVSSAAGRMPLIGDDDGGLLLPLDQRPPEDVRALLLAAAVTLQRPELIIDVRSPPSLAYWLCGVGPTERFLQNSAESPCWRDVHFAKGGLIVLRDGWTRQDAVAVVDAGPHGALSYGHSHADALAVTLTLGERELFIDRGTLTYVGAERNEFRSTGSHNTLELDGEPAALPGAPFRWRDVPPPAAAVAYTTHGCSGLIAAAHGHTGSDRPSFHRRIVLHQRGGAWVVLDRAWRPGTQRATVRWQLAPDLRAERQTASGFLIRDSAGRPIATVYAPLAAELAVVTREVSLRLGQHVPAQCLEITLPSSLEALTVIIPATAVDLTSLHRPAAEQGWSFDWSDRLGRHRVRGESATSGPAAPPGVAGAALSWSIDRSSQIPDARFAPDLVVSAATAMPQLTPEHPITAWLRASGRMSVFEKNAEGWIELPVAPVGCGDD
jgi:hypothetical protein